jgi:hypothetical protein
MSFYKQFAAIAFSYFGLTRSDYLGGKFTIRAMRISLEKAKASIELTPAY